MEYRILDSVVIGRKGVYLNNPSPQLLQSLAKLVTDPEWNKLTSILFFDEKDLGKVEAYLQQSNTAPTHTAPSAQLWAVIELFGHQIIAGAVSKVEPFGTPMVQVDVPATDSQPAFSKLLNPSAIYGITYVAEQVARSAANEARHKPVKVYIPEMADIDALIRENKALRQQLTQRPLDDSLHNENWGYDGDHG